MKLGELAARLDCPLEGDPNVEITSVAGIEEAQPGEITFFTHPRYRQALRQTRASAVILPPGQEAPHIPALRSKSPYVHFARAIEILYPPAKYQPGIHPTAVVAPSAEIGSGSHIGPYCFVDEGVRIGRNAFLHSFVSIYSGAQIGDDFFAHSHTAIRGNCRIGHRVILQNGVVLGADGFAFARREDGVYEKIRPTGLVVIGDDVEIQAQSAADSPTAGETIIKNGCKIDSFVQVGHSCNIGENTVLCAQVGLAGSINIGRNAVLAGQVGVADHANIGDGSTLTAQSGFHGDAPPGSFLSGSPAISDRQWHKNIAAMNYLPELLKTVRRLQSEVTALRNERGR